MRFRDLVLLMVISCPLSLWAQPVFDVAQLNGITMPVSGDGAGMADTLKPGIRDLQALLQLPLDLDRRNTLIVSPFFQQKSFAFPRIDSGKKTTPFLPADFTCYSFNLIYRRAFADTSWRLFTAFSVRHYGESGMGPGDGSITPAGAVFLERRFSRDFSIRAGGSLSREYFGMLWMPLVGFSWRASDRLWCWGLLPRFAVADYRLNEWWHMCLHFRGVNESYLYSERVEDRRGWLAIQEGHLRLAQEIHIPGTPLVWSLDVGYTVNRRMRAYDPSNAQEMESTPENGVIYRTSLAWRLRLDERFGREGP